MARGYQYSSDEIRREFRRMRDRLYREARRGGYSGAYNELKNELESIDYIDEDVLDYLETTFRQNIDVNRVDPTEYNAAVLDKVLNYIDDMIDQNMSYPNLLRKLRACRERLMSFIGEIGKYAFASFMVVNPDYMDYIEKIYEIYMQYLQGEISYAEFESQTNAILYILEGLYAAYPYTEEYKQYKQWERDMSAAFKDEFDIYDFDRM